MAESTSGGGPARNRPAIGVGRALRRFAALTPESPEREIRQSVDLVLAEIAARIDAEPDRPAARRNVSTLLDFLRAAENSRHPGRALLAAGLAEKIVPRLFSVEAPAGHAPAQNRQMSGLALFGLVFLPFATGYFLSFLYRSVNAVIAPDLIRDLSLSSSGLGLLTASFFLGFAALQLPLGVMLDRYGAVRVQTVLMSIAAAGGLMFALAESEVMLIVARGIIGVGCAGGLMAAFKAILRWFPPERLALVNGLFLAMGGLGAMMATQPVEWVLRFVDWRELFLGLAAATAVSALLIGLLTPRGDGASHPPSLLVQIRELRGIFADRLFWRLAPIAVMTMGGQMSIQGLWAGPWLNEVAGLARDQVALRLLALSAAMTVGFVLTGWVGDALRRRGVNSIATMTAGSLLMMVGLGAVTLTIDLHGWWHWLLFGLAGTSTTLCYSLISRYFGSAYAGRASTANVLFVFGGSFVLQYAMGVIVDLWPRGPDGLYPAEAYQAAFGAVSAGIALSVLWLLWPGPDKAKVKAEVM